MQKIVSLVLLLFLGSSMAKGNVKNCLTEDNFNLMKNHIKRMQKLDKKTEVFIDNKIYWLNIVGSHSIMIGIDKFSIGGVYSDDSKVSAHGVSHSPYRNKEEAEIVTDIFCNVVDQMKDRIMT